uniref:Uncharacterized protein n=1 Tax=Aplanochytrium stocchinoi TaxID=215587 RepID=A0A7S3PAV6_9STRA|mmetsp:Transcript_26938/g.32612  ORF Transcript_26938/g.32612 Transcript_26938/m.32612 type:complete len:240 (-) Transcript_26938:217-936(-)
MLAQIYPLFAQILFGPASAYIRAKTWDIEVSFPLGNLYAESFSSTLLAFALSPAVPSVLFVSLLLHVISYLVTKVDVLYHHKNFIASNPRFGSDVSVRLIQFLPFIGWLHLLSAVVQSILRSGTLSWWDVSAMSLLCLLGIFTLLWSGMYLYSYDVAAKRDSIIKIHRNNDVSRSSSVEVDEDEHAWAGATISFNTSTISSNTRDWQAALSLHQLRQDSLKDSFDEYRLPWVTELNSQF